MAFATLNGLGLIGPGASYQSAPFSYRDGVAIPNFSETRSKVAAFQVALNRWLAKVYPYAKPIYAGGTIGKDTAERAAWFAKWWNARYASKGLLSTSGIVQTVAERFPDFHAKLDYAGANPPTTGLVDRTIAAVKSGVGSVLPGAKTASSDAIEAASQLSVMNATRPAGVASGSVLGLPSWLASGAASYAAWRYVPGPFMVRLLASVAAGYAVSKYAGK